MKLGGNAKVHVLSHRIVMCHERPCISSASLSLRTSNASTFFQLIKIQFDNPIKILLTQALLETS
jgi:hypothetical protein